MLRNDECQLILSPRPPDGADIVQKRLFEDQYRVFYDPAVREAPQTEAEYLAADHATVVYEPRRSLDLDQHLQARGVHRRFIRDGAQFQRAARLPARYGAAGDRTGPAGAPDLHGAGQLRAATGLPHPAHVRDLARTLPAGRRTPLAACAARRGGRPGAHGLNRHASFPFSNAETPRKLGTLAAARGPALADHIMKIRLIAPYRVT